MYQLIDGKKTADEIKSEIAAKVSSMKERGIRVPHLAAVLVGHDGCSETYVAHKVKDCEEVGFRSTLVRFTDTVSEQELLAKVEEMNNDPEIDGLIVQLPLPGHISEDKIIENISPLKDVDGFHPINVGRMTAGLPSLVSATPAGIIDVGTTRVEAPGTKSGWRLKGDVDFENVAPRCSFITPVPGGVGPMTRVSLLLNTLKACRR